MIIEIYITLLLLKIFYSEKLAQEKKTSNQQIELTAYCKLPQSLLSRHTTQAAFIPLFSYHHNTSANIQLQSKAIHFKNQRA